MAGSRHTVESIYMGGEGRGGALERESKENPDIRERIVRF